MSSLLPPRAPFSLLGRLLGSGLPRLRLCLCLCLWMSVRGGTTSQRQAASLATSETHQTSQACPKPVFQALRTFFDGSHHPRRMDTVVMGLLSAGLPDCRCSHRCPAPLPSSSRWRMGGWRIADSGWTGLATHHPLPYPPKRTRSARERGSFTLVPPVEMMTEPTLPKPGRPLARIIVELFAYRWTSASVLLLGMGLRHGAWAWKPRGLENVLLLSAPALVSPY